MFPVFLLSCTQSPVLLTPCISCGTFVTSDEPIWIHYYELKSIVYIRVYSKCCAFYCFFFPLHSAGFDKCVTSCIHCHSITYHALKTPLSSTYSSLPMPTFPSSSFWDPEEPNNLFDEDCASMNKGGTWNDLSCDKTTYWICERKCSC